MIVKVYLHSNKEAMSDHGERLGLTGEALGLFCYACYEVTLDLDVDEETGKATIVAVDGRKVADGDK